MISMKSECHPFTIASLVVLAAACSGCSSTPNNPVAPSSATPASLAERGTYKLSGVVFESAPEGRSPLAGARVEVAMCPTRSIDALTSTVTSSSGYFEISQMCLGVTYVWIEKEGYRTRPPTQCDGDCLLAWINGDTHLDVELFAQ
jgi:hypothetical protein